MSVEDYKAGASAARNKLAGFLRERGLRVPVGYTPPEDDDFWYAIQEFAERYGATLPPFGEESVGARNYKKSLEAYQTGQQTRPPLIERSTSQTNSKELKCKRCGDVFVPKWNKPGFVDECEDCRRARSRRDLGISDEPRSDYLGYDIPEQKGHPAHQDQERLLEWFLRKLRGKQSRR
jgi:hypothetical protein